MTRERTFLSSGPGSVLVTVALLTIVSGVKATPLLNWSPIDPTIAASLVLVVVWLLSCIPRIFALRPPRLFLGILFLVVITIFLTRYETNYQAEKAIGLVLTLFAVIVAGTFYKSESQQKTWLIATAILGCVVGFLALLNPLAVTEAEGLATEGANTISIGRLAGLSFLVLVGWAFLSSQSKWQSRLIALVASVFPALVLVFSGARGPIAFLVVATVVMLIVSQATGVSKIMGVVFVIFLAFYTTTQVESRGGERFLTALSGGLLDSEEARSSLWSASTHAISSSPLNLLGDGWGTFPWVTGLQGRIPDLDGKLYPHNFVYEFWIEGGIILLLLILAAIVVAGIHFLRRRDSIVATIQFSVLVYLVGNALASGDVNDNRMLWVTVAMGFAPWLTTAVSDVLNPPSTDAITDQSPLGAKELA